MPNSITNLLLNHKYQINQINYNPKYQSGIIIIIFYLLSFKPKKKERKRKKESGIIKVMSQNI